MFHLCIYIQDGCTALYLASQEGHVAVIQLLLQRHADVSICAEVCTVTLGQCIVSILFSHTLEVGEEGSVHESHTLSTVHDLNLKADTHNSSP